MVSKGDIMKTKIVHKSLREESYPKIIILVSVKNQTHLVSGRLHFEILKTT